MNLDIPFLETRVAGVEVIINSDGGYSYAYTILNKLKGSVITEKSGSGIFDMTEILPSINTACPILLSINGRGIIHKKVSIAEGESEEILLTKVLPNSKLDDFYTQTFSTEPKTAYFSVVRRKVIEDILSSFTAAGYKVISCLVGPFAIQSVLPILIDKDISSSEIKFSVHDMHIKNGVIDNYTQLNSSLPETTIKKNSLEIKSSELTSFSTAFSYFNPIEQSGVNLPLVFSAFEEFSNELKFKKTGLIVLITLFTILFINFIVFSYLSDQVKEKSNKFSYATGELNMVDSLKRQIDERTAFLAKSGLSQPSRTSFYADQIAKDLPQAISLTAIRIQPLKKEDDNKDKMQFESKKILINGKAKYALDVNEWIKVLRNNKWVNTIALLNYKQKEGSDPGEFTIEIKFN